MKTQTSRRWSWLGVNACRMVLAVTFIFSGVVKLIDPRGTQYKIEDYAAAFHLHDRLFDGLPLSMAVALALFEFSMGVYLFFGMRRRLTLTCMASFLAVMAPLTLYLALKNPVTDCGCFGDAVVLTNWQTFAKNLVLVLATVICIWKKDRLSRFIGERNQWIVSLYSLVWGFTLSLYSLYSLPPVDFRPYRVGTDLPKAIEAEWAGEMVGVHYADFSMLTSEGNDITMEWLEREGYKFLLIAPYIEQADDGSLECINELYDYARRHDYPFLCLTCSDDEAIEQWCDRTGAEYPFAFTDGITLKTVVRSNPGLLLLKDGVVVRKWSNYTLPTLKTQDMPIEQLARPDDGQLPPWQRLLLWFFVPLGVVTLLDRQWWLWKKYRNKKRISQTN